MKSKRIFALLLSLLMPLSFTACKKQAYGYAPTAYLANINRLCVDDFGALSVTESIGPYVQDVQISEQLHLYLTTDAVTGAVQKADLTLSINTETSKLDYSTFSYFFLIMLKAYDSGISVGNINSIHDALGIETYTVGTNTQIGYGSSVYFYSVTAESATFTAQYSTPAAEDSLP